ncbi:hypothetical protein IW140_003303 [Coemansia sp. RSA 1813]|nr:hypothetical protein EV178_002922 [Coemansia sp. RSA 1646]KAJ1771711.1 hypothetical protein LPJ74_002138 [Coemansia sp. RSA 1843]KAJ2089652.1 hypothetical protein IW138_003250 [Coemansia sp. RSA 986]KAJ2214152.1 hypothetical protein EV179_003291 [Coemansia sp. RSA 487]KAJ2569211.1 hypothetical protein IW140_003303 [Coemansia sp. RSA 1813]
MRFSLFVLAVIATATTAFGAPVLFRRDMDGAVAAFKTIQGSANDAALVSNVNTFFSNLNGVAKASDLQLAAKQVSDQISANNLGGVPTSQTAAWAASTLVHFVQQ